MCASVCVSICQSLSMCLCSLVEVKSQLVGGSDRGETSTPRPEQQANQPRTELCLLLSPCLHAPSKTSSWICVSAFRGSNTLKAVPHGNQNREEPVCLF